MGQARQPRHLTQCEHCGGTEGVQTIPARTFHHTLPLSWQERILFDDPYDNSEAVDPNRPHLFCPVCAKDFTDYWDEMWNDYYNNIR